MAARTTITQTPVKYNQIPKESALIKRIKPLEKKERVQYRVHGAYDPGQPGKFFGRTLALPCEDTIMDAETGDVYDIAFIEGLGPGGIPQIGSIMFNDFDGSMITLSGDSAMDQRKYQYIELCNFLADNPNRDRNKALLIERIDESKDLNYKRDLRKKRQTALNVVEEMDNAEILNFIRANRIADPGSPEQRRAVLEDLAEAKPDKFIDMPSLDYTSLFPLIDDAKKGKIISWNNATREWLRHTGEVMLHVKKAFGTNNKDELAQYLIKEDGKDDLNWIKSELTK
jgi:hypothetical protein